MKTRRGIPTDRGPIVRLIESRSFQVAIYVALVTFVIVANLENF